jgi:16S rRNA (adenine1518-N6/adenine1519-N6)-dimethyltransferase
MTSSRSLLSEWNLRPKKQLGQNFLADPSTAGMIISRAGLTAEDVALEIGAGLGALTIPAARAVRHLYAVEKDADLARALESELRRLDIGNVHIINKDIFNVDIRDFSQKGPEKLVVLGNLPYNISSPVLFYLIDARDVIGRAVLMFQKELARRLMAAPGAKDYGRLSVMLQYFADLKRIATVSAHLFFPKPKVDSEVVEVAFKKKIENPVADEGILSEIVKAAFGKRRKTLKNALTDSSLKADAETIIRILAQAGISPSRRAETLSVSEFVALGNIFCSAIQSYD